MRRLFIAGLLALSPVMGYAAPRPEVATIQYFDADGDEALDKDSYITESGTEPNNDLILVASQVTFPDGTEAAPSITWESDDDNGFFNSGTDEIGVVNGGTKYWEFDGGRLTAFSTGDISLNGMLLGDNAREMLFDPGGEDATITFDTGGTTFDFTHGIDALDYQYNGTSFLGSVGVMSNLTSLTVDNITINGNDISNPNAFTFTDTGVTFLTMGTSGFVWNDNAGNNDFSIETQTSGITFFADTSAGAVYVGSNTGTAGKELDVNGDIESDTLVASGTITSTKYTNDQAANQGFELDARTTPSLAAPFVRATASNAVTAFDVMPNGTPSDSAGNGVAWLDIVDVDVSTTNPSLATARLGIFGSSPSNQAYVGSEALNGHAAIPFHIKVSQTDVAIAKTDFDFDVQNGLIVGDEIDSDGTGDSTFAGSLNIEGGISMGASAPATAEGILYNYRDAGDPFIILGSSSTEFLRFRGQAQDQLDLQKNGGTTSTEFRLGADVSLSMNEATSTPPNPTSDGQGRIYFKAEKLVIQWNDGGTVKYRYLTLDDTAATWTYTTSAP